MSPFRVIAVSAAILFALALTAPAMAKPEGPIEVVASFSVLGDMTERIGGEHVSVTTLVGPNGDAHVYQPTPAAARALSAADLFVVNGLQFEGWLDRLSSASDFDGERVVVTEGIEPIPLEEGHSDDHGHHHGVDPHAWQSLDNAVVYAENIAAALKRADPEHAETFQRNLAGYIDEIHTLDARIRQKIAALPLDRRTVVTSHDAFQYFGREYGLTFLAPQGTSTESEVSAKEVAELIRRIRREDISAVFTENIADSRLLERVADETHATVSDDRLYPGALSEVEGPAPNYLAMMRHNANALVRALDDPG